MACAVVRGALVVVFVALSGVAEAHVDAGRALLGSDVVFDEEQLAQLGVPRNAEILIQAGTDCPEPLPVGEEANNGLLCGFVLQARGCLNYTETKPFWIARNCKGQICTAVNSPWETECILGNYGVHIDVKNSSRVATCGLDPSDVGWLSPAINPAANTCSIVTPEGVRSDTWAECVNGRPKLQYRLTFDRKTRRMPKNKRYHCKISPMCLHGMPRRFHSIMVCYVEGKEHAGEEEEEGGVERTLGADKLGTVAVEETENGVVGGSSAGVGFGLRWILVLQALMGVVWAV